MTVNDLANELTVDEVITKQAIEYAKYIFEFYDKMINNEIKNKETNL